MNKYKDNFKVFIPFLVVIVLIIAVITISTSFGFFEYLKKSTTINKVSTGNLVIEVDDTTSIGVTSENSYPTSDEVGKSSSPYKFDLNNVGGSGANYEVKLIDDQAVIESDGCSNIQMPKSSLKYELIRNNEVVSTGLLSNLTDNVIDSGYISSQTVYNYELRIWISSDAGSEIVGKHFHSKIEVVISDSLNG